MRCCKITFFSLLAIIVLFVSGCSGCSEGSSGTDSGVNVDSNVDSNSPDYKQLMRDFVQNISSYAKGLQPSFIVIPQNGHGLLTTDGKPTGNVDAAYVAAIDGVGREDLFYGYDEDDAPTPDISKNYMIGFTDIAEENDLKVLVTDYCSTKKHVDESYQQNASRGYISFAANKRDLNDIPSYPVTPYNVNTSDVKSLSAAKNFLYLLDSDLYATKVDFINALAATNYDLLIIDPYYQGSDALTVAELASLKTKANGGKRLVIAYMSVGEAETYRAYWQPTWDKKPPSWLSEENESWPGNYKVEYWNADWQAIIYGNDSSYLKSIVDVGFDGVYLDIIDAYEYFEAK